MLKNTKAFLKITKYIRLIWTLVIAIALVKLGDRLLDGDPITAIFMAIIGISLLAQVFIETFAKQKLKAEKKKKARQKIALTDFLRRVK